MNRDITVYLDLDGVLVGYPKTFTPKPPSSGESNKSKFIREEEFWATLPWEYGGKEVYKAAKKLYERVCILSSAGPTPDIEMYEAVKRGKLQWLKSHNLTFTDIFIVRGKVHKQKYSTPMSILVDDVRQTINQWNMAGGMGIHHYYKNYVDTIVELYEYSKPATLSEMARYLKDRK